MKTVLIIIQLIVSVLLAGAILLQQRGGGLSPVFGGEGAVYRTRRGMEKTLFIGTIILAALFFIVGLLNLILQ
ncbi:MAG: Preprotein translocase, SecG subunit [Parcubacteria group bacterium GW2011_GWA2_45_30]|nr:MAG: Preprotein translocase, SecG subunit [Parcubacteria group bacterium GW2011_GWA2_45_30]